VWKPPTPFDFYWRRNKRVKENLGTYVQVHVYPGTERAVCPEHLKANQFETIRTAFIAIGS
jgi:hypothetical protein